MEIVIERLELLLLVAAIVSMAARKLKLPYTVGLVIAGVIIAAVTGTQPLTLTRDLIFTTMLPPLVFEAALQLNWQQLKKELPIVSLLATVGVLLSATIVATGMHWLLGWSWAACGVVAVLLSATDPVAVIATFKDLRIKGRIQLLVEAESLFNDGIAAVLFSIGMSAAAGVQSTALGIAGNLLLTTFGGIVCGLVVAWVAIRISGKTDDHLVEITFTTITAYGAFLLAEHFHLSGVLAVLSAGILYGNLGPLADLTEKGSEAVLSFWEYVAFLANSIIFLLIGSSLIFRGFSYVLKGILFTVVLLLVGRAVSVYLCSSVFARTKLRLPWAHQHILFWGGLRGALALALALGLPHDFEHRDDILSLTFGVVAFSVVAQGLTMPGLLKRLGFRKEVDSAVV